MKLLRMIAIFFIIYFIRRFIQAYKAMKFIQEENQRQQQEAQAKAAREAFSHQHTNQDVINADFRVID